MASIFRRALKLAVYNPVAEALLHRIHGHQARILTYHRFPESAMENFARQCDYLQSHYHPISLDQLVESIKAVRPLPPRSVVVTVDDGYRDVYRNAAPILQRYRIPATVFLVSGFLDGCWLWWDAIMYAFLNSPLQRAELHLPGREPATVALGTPEERKATAERISVYLVQHDNSAAAEWCREIGERLEVKIPERVVPPFDPMSWDEARQLADGGGITFGSHTVNHRVLGTLLHEENKRLEGFASRARIEAMLDRPVQHFCFPNGGIADFSQADLALIREAGYSSASTTLIGMMYPDAAPFQLPRINADAAMDFWFFRMKIAGLFQHVHAVNLPARLPEN